MEKKYKFSTNMERDPKVTGIFESWNRVAPTIPRETLDKIAELYITKILDCTEESVNLLREEVTNDEIGLKHAGVTDYQADSRAFWTEVNKVSLFCNWKRSSLASTTIPVGLWTNLTAVATLFTF